MLGHYLFLVAHSFPRASLSKTVRFSEQIMSADKYPSIFSRQMVTIVYIANDNIANQIHGFTTDYRKFILKKFISSRVILQVVLKID